MTLRREFGELCYSLIDEDGHVAAKFDCSKMDVAPMIAKALLRAHAALYGHTAIATQSQNWRWIRKFVLCLQSLNLKNRVPLPASVANEFHIWLKETGLSGSTMQSTQNTVFSVLRWCSRNAFDVVQQKTSFAVPPFARGEPRAREALSMNTAMTVLDICYSKIEIIEARILKGQALLSDKGDHSPEDAEIAKTLRDLLLLGNGRIPGQRVVVRAKQSLARRVVDCGGLGTLKSLICVTTSDIFPFYLSVIVQTGGNPMAIRRAEVDCITTHPLRSDIEYLNWEKGRGSRVQRVDFPVGKKWAAPNIIRRLLTMNSGLRPYARASDRNSVFLSLGLRTDQPTVPSVQSLHNYLFEFIEENGLPDFDFGDWRLTSARLHHEASGSIEVPKKRLNHRDTRTTSLYTSIDKFPETLHRAITRFQGQLATGKIVLRSRESKRHDAAGAEKAAGTVFGFNCSNPFEGADGVTPVGVRCENFTRCSTCQGAIVLLDDPKIIARILAAKAALEQAKERALRRGWMPRFFALYADTFEIINNEILPAITPPVMKQAAELAKMIKIPDLE
jgi:hypothetical protein